jgi:hypothetical protein
MRRMVFLFNPCGGFRRFPALFGKARAWAAFALDF